MMTTKVSKKQPSLPARILEYQGDNWYIARGDLCQIVGRKYWFRFLYADGHTLTFWGPVKANGKARSNASFRSYPGWDVTKVKSSVAV